MSRGVHLHLLATYHPLVMICLINLVNDYYWSTLFCYMYVRFGTGLQLSPIHSYLFNLSVHMHVNMTHAMKLLD
jgi:hypothetical protein